MDERNSRARPSDQALAVPVEPASSLAPTGFDPSREALSLSPQERLYLIHTPLQMPIDAGLIAYYAHDGCGHGARFAGFARRHTWLFQRLPNSYGTAYTYRLSKDGSLVRAAASAIEARRAETLCGSVADESAVVATSDETPKDHRHG